MSKLYKKQPLDIVVSGITLRYSMKYNIWVNWAGTRAYRKYNDSSWNRFLQIHTDINGSKFLNVNPKTVQLDEAVADAYNPCLMTERNISWYIMTGTWGTVKPITLNGKRLENMLP